MPGDRESGDVEGSGWACWCKCDDAAAVTEDWLVGEVVDCVLAFETAVALEAIERGFEEDAFGAVAGEVVVVT
jgi:hypothetical protein